MLGWDDAYSIGIDSIDRQHQELFHFVNEMESAALREGPRHAPAARIAELMRQMKRHFRAEELLFVRHKYPEAGIHKRQHDTFLFNLGEFKDRFDRGIWTTAADAVSFISDWLVDHITRIDARYSSFFLEAGLGASSSETL